MSERNKQQFSHTGLFPGREWNYRNKVLRSRTGAMVRAGQ